MKNGDPRFDDKKYYGSYRAIVKNNADDKKLGRVILQVPEIFGSTLLTDWASPKNGYFSGMDKGDFNAPDVGDGVWAEFEAGDSHRPLYSGRWWAMPGGISEVPKLARGQRDESQMPPKGTDFMITATGEGIDEPAVAYAAQYPKNRVFKTKNGIVFEVDDTDGQMRVALWHPGQSSPTYFEIRPDGGVVCRVGAEAYMVVEGTSNLHVLGDFNTVVEGDHGLQVNGEYRIEAVGNIILESQASLIEKAPTIMQNSE